MVHNHGGPPQTHRTHLLPGLGSGQAAPLELALEDVLPELVHHVPRLVTVPLPALLAVTCVWHDMGVWGVNSHAYY